MKASMRFGPILFASCLICGVAGGVRADFAVVSPFNEAAAGFFNFQQGPITYPGGGPFLTATILADRYVESAILFDLRRFRSLGATITGAVLTVDAVAYGSGGPSGPTLFAEALTNATGLLQASDFPTPGTTLPVLGAATLPTPGSTGDIADVPLNFDVTPFLATQLASGADFAGVVFRVQASGDSVDLASTSAPAMARPPSLALTYTPVPSPGSLALCGQACLAGLGYARTRRRRASAVRRP